MNKLFKGMMSILLFSFLSMGNVVHAHASEVSESDSSIELNLDLESNEGSSYVSKDGEFSVEITKEPSFYTLNNGSYKITTRRKGSWNATFTINIHDYRIVSAGKASAQAIVGSFIYKNLKINNASTATYYLTRKVGAIIYKIDFIAKIENKNLKVIVN